MRGAIRPGLRNAVRTPFGSRLTLSLLAWSSICLGPARCLSQATPADDAGRKAIAASNERIGRALSELDKINNIDDMINCAKKAVYNEAATRDDLWIMAANVSLMPPGWRSPAFYENLLKTVEYATILSLVASGEEKRWESREEMLGAGGAAVEALRRETNYPAPGNGLLRLLDRRPRIERKTLDGMYHQHIFIDNVRHEMAVYERADTPVAGLSRSFLKAVEPLPPGRADAPPLEGSVYCVGLAGLYDVVAAAKVIYCASLIGGTVERTCAQIVAGRFLAHAHEAGIRSGDAPLFLVGKALDSLEKRPLPRLDTNNIRTVFAATCFECGRLRRALRAYQDVLQTTGEDEVERFVGTWGVAICRLALNDPDVADSLEKVVVYLETHRNKFPEHEFIIHGLCHIMGPGDMGIKANSDAGWYGRARGWSFDRIEDAQRYSVTLSARTMLLRMGRWEESLAFMMRELSTIRSKTSKSNQLFEKDILTSIFLVLRNEAFDSLAWTRDEQGVWSRLKDPSGMERVNDFAPFWAPGEDPRLKGTPTERYGMIDPEEDLATCYELYGDRSDEQPADLRAAPEDFVAKDEGSPRRREVFRTWVREALAATPSNPVPLLKLVCIEWFDVPSAAFPGLDATNFREWRYRPANRMGLTAKADVETAIAKTGASVSPSAGHVWGVFKSARDFLDANYGPQGR